MSGDMSSTSRDMDVDSLPLHVSNSSMSGTAESTGSATVAVASMPSVVAHTTLRDTHATTSGFGTSSTGFSSGAATTAPECVDPPEMKILKAQLEIFRLEKIMLEEQLQTHKAATDSQPPPPPLRDDMAVEVQEDDVNIPDEYNYNVSYVCVVAALILWVFINLFWIILIAYAGGGLRCAFAYMVQEQWAVAMLDRVHGSPKQFIYGCGCSLVTSFVLCHFSFVILIGLALAGTYTAKLVGLDTTNAIELFELHFLSVTSTPCMYAKRIKNMFTRRTCSSCACRRR